MNNTQGNEVSINLTEMIRREVKEALKTILAQTLDESNAHSGDFGKGVQPQKTLEPRPTAQPESNGVTKDEEFLLPVKVVRSDGTIQHRRKKRTQAEMKEAINNILPTVKAKHPDWSDRRLKRLAKNLVRRYKE